ncbi:MAG: NifU family protein [Helicobacteraceae bacterium]|jgi:Fe-S cluster biogenesis protein NfuA|nr:NifU family protein [Helicobacteraceae bacterium]
MRFPFTDEELFPAVERALNEVRSALQKDGGDIELARVRQKEVFVRLKGACVGCGSSANTLKQIVERAIRSRIHPEMIVIDETAANNAQNSAS